MKNLFLIMLQLAAGALHPLLAQLPYTQKQYPVTVETEIPFGTANGFAGEQLHLRLDLYKPLGDQNCRRPLLVMVHGGGFIAGTKNDVDVVQICQEMAARGYVCASVNYRLGMHPLPFYTPYAFCNDGLNPLGINKCIYAADSLEIGRAMYRATQDVKGAIRFLKGRHEADSTDVNSVFVGGSSAGAITALNAALMDLPSEKPAYALALPDAPTPDADLASCVPAPANPARPDLGTVDGDLNLNGHDASVQGVAAFMGGTFDLGLLDGAELPAFYLYHRTDDLVVPSNSAPLFMLYPYCLNPINLCQPLNTRPTIHGSESLSAAIASLGNDAPPFFDDILTSYGPADGDDCLDNPPGHSIDNLPLRCENLGGFFATIIAENGNSPTGNCVSSTAFAQNKPSIRVYPNPVRDGVLRISCADCGSEKALFLLLDATGRALATASGSPTSLHWQLPSLPGGLHFLHITSPTSTQVFRLWF